MDGEPRVIYKVITKAKQVDELIAHCKATGYCSSDFETNAKSPQLDEAFPTILGVSFQPGSSWVIPLGHKDSPFKKRDRWVKIIQKFGREVIENPDIVKIGQNVKFEYLWWKRLGVDMVGVILDTMLAKYLLDEERPHGLKPMVDRFLPQYSGYSIKEQDEKKGKFDWENADFGELCKYCALDSDLTFRIMMLLERRLIDLGFYLLFRNIMMMLTRVLGDSEYQGMRINVPYLDSLVTKYTGLIASNEEELRRNKKLRRFEKAKLEEVKTTLIESVNREIEELSAEDPTGNAQKIKNREEKVSRYVAGEFTTNKEKKLVEPTNFNSSDQMKELFYYHPKGFKFPEQKTYKKGENKVSTDEASLLKLKDLDKWGFIDALLKHRELTKLSSTYIYGVRERVTPKGYLHTSYLIHGTVTGRLSSRDPNLQNIPRATTNPDIKKMFIPPEGHLIMEIDYSQAELRVVAEVANEKAMIDAFSRGWNIHVATAAKMAGIPYEELYPLTKDESHPKHEWATKQKKKGKIMNFSILYEQGDKMTAEALGVSEDEAIQFKADWFKAFPKVKAWRDKQHSLVDSQEFVVNMFGRKRRFTKALDNGSKGAIAEAKRQSVNAPIQGTSSDFTQFSAVIIREKNLRGEFPFKLLPQCYTVHDSIGFYIKPEQIHTMVPILTEICSDPQTQEFFGFQMKKVKMKVSVEIGKTWGTFHEYDPSEDYSKWLSNDNLE